MSVGAFITNPVSEAERVFYLPILTEQPFREFLRPLAEKHDLLLIAYLGVGFPLDASLIDRFARELGVAIKMADDGSEIGAHVVKRLSRLSAELQRMFTERPGVELFVG